MTPIEQIIAERAEAMRLKDAERVVATYAPEVVIFDLAPPLSRAGAEVTSPDGIRAWFDGFAGPLGYDVTDLVVTAGADVAFCHSLNRLAATPHGFPEGFEMWFRATTGLRVVDGEWKITHEHTSTPFYMDGSFRAATDLRP
ncbi:YybH family protein [Allokutzneria albata]|uniref:Ketosteroid isomerase homolog n=1 Tax=Allokutzneria albata TaxID=211114 RepID=A0A1G9TD70_ALLAB|nr:nuclear transport factor 2 family protein [Allokutzneria albata]SDM45095.1 Ketosteroid isomerase homolog [Allokutzneria albata]